MLNRSPMKRGTGFKSPSLKQGLTLKRSEFKPRQSPPVERTAKAAAVQKLNAPRPHPNKQPSAWKFKRNKRPGADPAYLGRVAALGCRICRRLGYGFVECQVHHQRTGTGGGRRAPDKQSVGLCMNHHTGQDGIHHMGRKRWEERFGVTEVQLIEDTQRELGVFDES